MSPESEAAKNNAREVGGYQDGHRAGRLHREHDYSPSFRQSDLDFGLGFYARGYVCGYLDGYARRLSVFPATI